jgi:hypothetical protein
METLPVALPQLVRILPKPIGYSALLFHAVYKEGIKENEPQNIVKYFISGIYLPNDDTFSPPTYKVDILSETWFSLNISASLGPEIEVIRWMNSVAR